MAYRLLFGTTKLHSRSFPSALSPLHRSHLTACPALSAIKSHLRQLGGRNLASVATSEELLLPGFGDNYEGVTIQSDSLPQDPDLFSQQLHHSLHVWREQQKRGIWLKLSLAQAALIPVAVSLGFDFRHAESGQLVLTKWLEPKMPNLLPHGATHQVGVGAFVLNDNNEALLVQEGLGRDRGQGVWKLPTGLTNLGEDVNAAAEREVWEETGIRTTFNSILAVRQAHGAIFGRSDLFFVCSMKLSPGKQSIRLQKTELAAADWHSLESVENGSIKSVFSSGPMFKTILACLRQHADGTYPGLTLEKLYNGFNPRSDILMHGINPQDAS